MSQPTENGYPYASRNGVRDFALGARGWRLDEHRVVTRPADRRHTDRERGVKSDSDGPDASEPVGPTQLSSAVRSLGALPLIAVGLGMIVYFASLDVPVIDGYTWMGPLKTLRFVMLKADFPKVVATAWVLGLMVRGAAPLRLREILDRVKRFVRTSKSQTLDRTLLVTLLVTVAVVAAVHVVAQNYGPVDLVLVGFAVAYLHRRRLSGDEFRAFILDLSRAVLVFAASSYVFTIIKAMLFRAGTISDDVIINAEAALFGVPPHRVVVAWVRDKPMVVDFLDQIYFHFFEHMTAASVFLAAAGLRAQRSRLWSALAICYLLGGPAYYLLPGVGPAFYEPALYEFAKELPLLSNITQQVLLDNTNRVARDEPMLISTYAFIACMPSLHMAHEFVMLYYARFSRPFFVASTLFAAASSVAILALGWHYALDIAGGLLLAGIAVGLAETLKGRLLPALRETAPPAESRPRQVLPVLTLLFAALAHAPSLANGYLDRGVSLLSENPFLLELKGLGTLLSVPTLKAAGSPENAPIYRPVAALFNWVSYQLVNAHPPSQHLVSIGLLGALGLLLWRAFGNLGVGRRLAIAMTALVIAHPLAAEVTAAPTERDVLLGWIVIVGLIPSLRSAKRLGWHVGLVFCGVLLAALSHESFLALSLSLLIVGHWGTGSQAARAGASVGAYFAAVLTVIGLRAAVHVPSHFTEPGMTLDSIRLVGPAAGRGLTSVFLPLDLSPWVTLVPSGIAGSVAFAVGAVTLMFVGSRVSWKERAGPRVAFQLGVGVVALSVMASAVTASRSFNLADGNNYSVLVGIVLMIGGVLAEVRARLEADREARVGRLGLVSAALLLFALLPLTWSRDLAYRDEDAARGATIADRPQDPRAWAFRGQAMVERGELEDGLRLCEEAKAAVPRMEEADFCMGMGLVKLMRPREGVVPLKRVIRRQASNSRARAMLLDAMLDAGQYGEARKWIVILGARFPGAPDVGSAALRYEAATGESLVQH